MSFSLPVVGCLHKKGLQNGGSGGVTSTPGLPSYAPTQGTMCVKMNRRIPLITTQATQLAYHTCYAAYKIFDLLTLSLFKGVACSS